MNLNIPFTYNHRILSFQRGTWLLEITVFPSILEFRYGMQLISSQCDINVSNFFFLIQGCAL